MSCSVAPVAAGHMVSCAATTGTFNTSQVATANLVTATVTISGTAASNYTLGIAGTSTNSSGATATAHITTANLTITASGGSMIYGGPVFPVMPLNYIGFEYGERPSNLTTHPTGGTYATTSS